MTRPHVVLAIGNLLAATDLTEEIKSLDVPVSIVLPDSSPFVPVQHAVELHRLAKDSKLRVVPGVRHGLPFVHAREDRNGARVESPLTPAHALSLVGMWEREEWGRVGVEYYFTGAQRLKANPYRDRSESYSILGFLVERKIGRFKVFLNAENLTDARQTKFDPLVRPRQAADGRLNVDAWAPLDGRTFNAGIRATF